MGAILEKIQDLKTDLQVWYDDWLWKNSPESEENLQPNEFYAHEKAMREGRNSPYTHPEEYDSFY